MEWPPDLERHILGLSWGRELAPIAREIRDALRPHATGSLENPFFLPGPTLEPSPLERIRRVTIAMPPLLVPLYESHDDAVEFVDSGGTTYLSERAMARSAVDGVVDFAFHYHGMGHVLVFTYRPQSDSVMTFLDGGSSGHDRPINAAARAREVRRFASSGTCDEPWGPVLPFVEWWRRRDNLR